MADTSGGSGDGDGYGGGGGGGGSGGSGGSGRCLARRGVWHGAAGLPKLGMDVVVVEKRWLSDADRGASRGLAWLCTAWPAPYVMEPALQPIAPSESGSTGGGDAAAVDSGEQRIIFVDRSCAVPALTRQILQAARTRSASKAPPAINMEHKNMEEGMTHATTLHSKGCKANEEQEARLPTRKQEGEEEEKPQVHDKQKRQHRGWRGLVVPLQDKGGGSLRCAFEDKEWLLFRISRPISLPRIACCFQGPLLPGMTERTHEFEQALLQSLQGRCLVLPLRLSSAWLAAHCNMTNLPAILLTVPVDESADTPQDGPNPVHAQSPTHAQSQAPSLPEDIDPSQPLPVKVTGRTKVVVASHEHHASETQGPALTPGAHNTAGNKLAGLSDALEALCDIVRLPFSHDDLFAALGTDAPRGVLLHGPPGCGKTLLVAETARLCKAFLRVVHAQDIQGAYVGETEANLRRAFAEARAIAAEGPCILFLDELDAICPRRDNASMHHSRTVAQLLTLMDGMASRGKLVVVAATNRPHAIDPALRRPGRFDREVHIATPTAAQRREIFELYLRPLPLDTDVDVDALATAALGFVGADINAACRRAATAALRSRTAGSQPRVCQAQLLAAVQSTVPSVKRDAQLSISPVTWDDIGGLHDVKLALKKALEWPFVYADAFEQLGITPARGVLLYGPPGCSKTTLARAVATSCQASFFSLSGAQVYSPYVGDSEKAVRDVFDRARKSAPSVIFLDEVDAIVGKRSSGDSGHNVAARVLSTVLNEMDGIEAVGHVIVIAATNRPDMLDSAFLRAGRMDNLIYVPHPDRESREAILRVYTKKTPLASDVDLSAIAESTEYYTGADLKAVVMEAALHALRRNIASSTVTQTDLDAALSNVAPSLTREKIEFYAHLRPNRKQQLF